MREEKHIIEKHVIQDLPVPHRLSDYITGLFPQYPSRKGIKKAIKRGEVLLNGEVGKTGDWVKTGDEICLIRDHRNPPAPLELPLEIVYQDEHLAVIIKPAGLPVHGPQHHTLANALVWNLPPSGLPDALPWAHPVHRLDAPTSGLLLVARTRSAENHLRQAFSERKVEKTYRAVVMGKPKEKGEFDTSLDGKPAQTSFCRLQTVPSRKNGHISLLELHPHTGRTHQLRRHLAGAGYAILGDKKYSPEGMLFRGEGLFLCATGLRFQHPHSGRWLELSIPEPPKFSKRLQREKRMWHRFTSGELE